MPILSVSGLGVGSTLKRELLIHLFGRVSDEMGKRGFGLRK